MVVGEERFRVVMIEIKAGVVGFLVGAVVIGGVVAVKDIRRPVMSKPIAASPSLHSQWPSRVS